MITHLRVLKNVSIGLIATASIFLQGSLQAQGLINLENPPGVVSLFDPSYRGLQRFFVDSTLFAVPFNNYSRHLSLDSAQTKIIIEEKLFNRPYRLPVVADLNYYMKQRIRFDNRQIWMASIFAVHKAQAGRGGGGIELNIPVKIKSKTFRRIFGGDRVGLRVSGNISFELAGRTESREGSALSSIESRGNFSPKFKQTQQFRVEGRVGDKVTVSVDQNSEATFDFENTLKLTYEGDPDEIVQRIEAGNVALSLPSTKFVSTSANHQGLFGIKTQLQLGNFSFVGIASLERGESEKISVEGGSREQTFRIKDYEYIRNRFFFVDTVYRDNFENSLNTNNMLLSLDTSLYIRQLDVWKTGITTSGTNFNETFDGLAGLNPDNLTDDTPTVAGRVEQGQFERLTEGVDYKYDFQRGYFWLTSRPGPNEIVAVAYATNTDTVGMVFQEIEARAATDTSNLIIKLRLIKADTQNPEGYPTWSLSMRNVYNMGGAGITPDKFDAKVIYSITGEEQETDPIDGQTYNFLLGIDRLNEQQSVIPGGDKKVDKSLSFLFDFANGYMIFPSLTPFNPLETSDFNFNPERHVDIYFTQDRTFEQQESKFEIEVKTKSVSTSFDLGFNVLEGSETVTLNGKVMTRDKDYTIDYFSGSLEITAPEARRTDAQVEIEYERGALFQLDKKSFLGSRLEYRFGERNFIGLTSLFYSKSTLDQRVRLGQEPLKNMVFDINTALSFRPNFLTSLFDKLPIVETSAESNLKIEAEYAQVNPNPNTFNESNLGDNDGVAYIDDFEGSRRFTSLGIQFRVWTPASVPAHFHLLSNPRISYGPGLNSPDPSPIEDFVLAQDLNRIQLNWFNPFNQVAVQSIWPDRDVTASSGTTTTILTLRWRNTGIPTDSAWAGVMRSTSAFPDQQKTKFIELWVKGETGQLNIDIGRISEDYWVRGQFPDPSRPGVFRDSYGNLNTEDVNLNGLLDLLDSNFEDVGIDGVPGKDGTNVANDAGDDDWADIQSTNPNFLRVNGTEGNSNAQGTRIPDTEDLDGNGSVNTFNDYFGYSFSLADTTFLVSRTLFGNGSPTGWKQYRIPLDKFQFKVGDPDTTFQQIFNVRVWVNDVEPGGPGAPFDSVQIATIDFVGNEWEEVGYQAPGESAFALDENRFSITVFNSEEHSGEPIFYTSPPNVEGIKDRITRAISKEQSLVLQLKNLDHHGSQVQARKQLRKKINLINYKRLKMFVHGADDLLLNREGEKPDSLIFYIRFGPTDKIYYEYREPVYPGWDERNELALDFEELAKTKNIEYRYDPALGLFGVPENDTTITYRHDPNFPEKEFLVVGNPGLHNINYMIFGVYYSGDFDLEDSDIWVDEMRVTGVERETGAAIRISSDLTIADIATFRAQWELVDDNFRRAEQQFASANGKDVTKERQSYFASLKLHKFLPESWGFEIPIDAKLTRVRNVPKYFFNSDERTNYEVSGVQNQVRSLFGFGAGVTNRLKESITSTETKSIGGTLRRRKKNRDPWYLRYTFNEMVFDLDYSQKRAHSPIDLFNNNNSIRGQFSYQIPFGKKNYFKPFAWLGKTKLLKPITQQKFYYTPSNAGFNYSITDNEDLRQERLQSNPTRSISVNNTRRMNMAYKLTESITMDFNRDFASDPFVFDSSRAADVLKNIFSNLNFGVDKRISQRFSARYSPKLFTWLKGNYQYTSNFVYSLDRPLINDRRSSLTKNRNIHFEFMLATLLEKIYKPKKGKKTPANLRRRNQQKPKEDKEEDQRNNDEKKKKKKKPGIKPPNPLIAFWSFLTSFKSISFDIKYDDNFGHFNLDNVPVWKYQFGFQESPGVGQFTGNDSIQLVLTPPSIRNTRTLDGSTQIDLFRNLKANLKYNNQKVDNFSNDVRTQTTSNTIFFISDDPGAFNDEDSSFNHLDWWDLIPDWRLNLTGVEKLPLFRAFAKSATVEHSRSGKFSETKREGQRDVANYSLNYQPFIGINVNTIWNITATLRSNRSLTFDYRTAGATTKRTQSGFNFNASYSVTKGFKLPIPFLNKKKLNNEIQFSLAIDKSNSLNESKNATDTSFEELDKSSNFKVRPSITYRFSQKVNGTAFFERNSSENKRTGKTTFNEFGFNVNIAIR